MPRPGPRPYECVRRAWHSERHPPMRGSIIQQIFRVVHDAHSAASKKNKEWLEKLPIVVLKSEEIMYSKANSEAEYMDHETLWDRLNDAINTIIRRDESTETGELLPPCIEAALNLGCIPVRASRSQRHSNPRSYLCPRQEPTSSPTRVLDRTNNECSLRIPSLHQSNASRASTAIKSTVDVPQSSCHRSKNVDVGAVCGYSVHENNSALFSSSVARKETLSNTGSVYPLYYWNHCQGKAPQVAAQDSAKKESDIVFIGKPVGTTISKPAEMGVLRNLFPSPTAHISSSIAQADHRNDREKVPMSQCDLSLKLSLPSEPCTIFQRRSDQETKDVGLSPRDRSMYGHTSLEKSTEFNCLPSRVSGNLAESSSVNWFYERDVQNLDSTVRNRKRPFNDYRADGQFYCPPPFLSEQFNFRPEGPDVPLSEVEMNSILKDPTRPSGMTYIGDDRSEKMTGFERCETRGKW